MRPGSQLGVLEYASFGKTPQQAQDQRGITRLHAYIDALHRHVALEQLTHARCRTRATDDRGKPARCARTCGRNVQGRETERAKRAPRVVPDCIAPQI